MDQSKLLPSTETFQKVPRKVKESAGSLKSVQNRCVNEPPVYTPQQGPSMSPSNPFPGSKKVFLGWTFSKETSTESYNARTNIQQDCSVSLTNPGLAAPGMQRLTLRRLFPIDFVLLQQVITQVALLQEVGVQIFPKRRNMHTLAPQK